MNRSSRSRSVRFALTINLMLAALAMSGLGTAVTSKAVFAAPATDKIVVPGDFSTIQAAVNAALPGATITVQRGIYVEEIVISKDLTVKGDGVGQTIVQAPATLTSFALQLGRAVSAVVRITDGAHVNISGLTVTGPFPCSDVSAGIRVIKGATLELKDSYLTRARPESGPCPSGPPRGRGVVVGLPANVQIDGQSGSSGHAIIKNVVVDKYQEVGIGVVAPTLAAQSTATISNSTITGGASPFAPVGQIGIQIAAATVGRVLDNTVSGNTCTFPFCGPDLFSQAQGIGIILQGVGASSVSEIKENDVAGNDVGIYQFFSPNCCSLSENRLKNNPFFGIVIQDGDGATFQNEIKGGQVGIAVVASVQNTTGLLRGDRIQQTSVAPVRELACCGFTATANVTPH